MPHQVEVDPSPLQLGEIALYATEDGIELHSHRQHAIARDHASVPDPAPQIGVLVPVGIDHDILPRNFVDLRRAGEVLIPVRR